MENTSIAEKIGNKKYCILQKWLPLILVCTVILCCTLPMGFVGIWNGKYAAHRNQYELMAEAILDGKLYIDYQEEDQLLQLNNPYDPLEREESGVDYHWDHAYYNGRYYMYFGVVPVFVLFIPYRLLTGSALTTYHATQVFAAFTILGIFALFDLLRKRFFKELPYVVSLILAAVFSVITVRFSIAEPALYCTAITGALAFQIWSMYFFIKAVWMTEGQNKQLKLAAVGAFLGALAFGCRPTIALANLLVVPMLICFLGQHKMTPALFGKLVLAAMPYFVIGGLLMVYNFARFGNPFEFGQSYQLTLYDISEYSATFDLEKLKKMVRKLFSFWFKPIAFSKEFPFIKSFGILTKYPIMLALVGMYLPSFWKALRKEKMLLTVIGICVMMAVISFLEVLWSPVLMKRYQMDLYFLLCILCYLIIGFSFQKVSEAHRKHVSGVLIALAGVSLVLCVVFYVEQLLIYNSTLGNIIG